MVYCNHMNDSKKRSDAAKLLGSLGGKKTLKEHGKEYMSELAAKAGKAMKKKYGKEYFAELSRKAAAARTKKAQERKAKKGL